MKAQHLIIAVFTIWAFLIPVYAQQTGIDVKVVSGYSLGLDDGPHHHWLSGLSARLPVNGRISIEPEILYADGFGDLNPHNERAILISVTTVTELGRFWRLEPHLSAGVGLTEYRATVPNELHFFDSSLPRMRLDKDRGINLTIGFGTRMFITDRWFLAPDIRIGLIPMGRATIGIGRRF